MTTSTFVGIVMKNNPAKFRFTARKNQGAKVISVKAFFFLDSPKRSVQC